MSYRWRTRLPRKRFALGLWEVLPSVGSVLPEVELPEVFVEDLIEAANRHLIDPTPENLRWAYKHEVSIQMIAKLIHESIDGAGWELAGDPALCSKFSEQIYPQINMSEWLEITTENLVIHGNQIWVPRFQNKSFLGLFPLDWDEIAGRDGGGVYRHPTLGYMSFIQKTRVPEELPMTREDWEKLGVEELEQLLRIKLTKKFIYHEPDVVYIRIGSRGYPTGSSPLEPILHIVAFKKLMEFYMCRGAEIWWNPFMVGKTGDIKKMPSPRRPDEWAAYQKRIEEFADLLAKYRTFGVFSLAADQDLDIRFPGRGIIDFPRFLQYLKTEIVQCLLGSTALFEARGVELATSRTIKNVWNEALDGWRRLYECALNMQFHQIVKKKMNWKGQCTIKFKRGWATEEDIEKFRKLMKIGERE